MSKRGVRQLKELLIQYSDYDGSSRGIRQWMSENLLKFAQENPSLNIKADLKRSKHPFVRGTYLNGNSKTIGIKNLDIENINEQIFHLRNQIGRKLGKEGYKKPVMTRTPSLQGQWHERMDLIDLEFKIVTK